MEITNRRGVARAKFNKEKYGAKLEFLEGLHTILYFKITYIHVVIKKKKTQWLTLYEGSPKKM